MKDENKEALIKSNALRLSASRLDADLNRFKLIILFNSIVLFPNDQDLRWTFHTDILNLVELDRLECKGGSDVSLNLTLRDYSLLRKYLPVLEGEIQKAFDKVITVAIIGHTLTAMAFQGLTPSLNKAIEVCFDRLLTFKSQTGRKVPHSRKSIRDAIASHGSVMHMATAWRLIPFHETDTSLAEYHSALLSLSHYLFKNFESKRITLPPSVEWLNSFADSAEDSYEFVEMDRWAREVFVLSVADLAVIKTPNSKR